MSQTLAQYEPAVVSNTAFRYEMPPLNPAFLFREQEQSEDYLLLSRLNENLQNQFGEEFYLQSFTGNNLLKIPKATLLSLAQCYADVFNESWGESWTVESALEEIKECINCSSEYLPIMTVMFKDERVIGFCWAYLLETSALHDQGSPFSSSAVKRHDSIRVAKYWMNTVARHDSLLSIRELGVIKEYRQEKAPYLTLPIFEKVAQLGCKVAFFRTKITSKAFKWSLGVGFVPLQFFMVDELLLMKGSIKYAIPIINGSIDRKNKRKAQITIISNIKNYLCE